MMITISLDGEALKRARRMLPGTDGAVTAALEDALRGMRAETDGGAGGYKSGWVNPTSPKNKYFSGKSG